MDAMFYVHGYNELRIAIEELLGALGTPNDPEGDG